MKTTMKKTAAWLLAILLAFQVMPVLADNDGSYTSEPFSLDEVIDKLKISCDKSIVMVGATITVSYPAEYQDLIWKVEPEGILEGSFGQFKAIAAGQVKITAIDKDNSNNSDSLTLKVLEAKTPEDEGDEEMTILVNVGKIKLEYDGQPHTAGFTAESNAAGFDASLVTLKVDEKTATNCGITKVEYSKDDFLYDGQPASFIVNGGWIQIKQKEATVKADDKETYAGAEPEFTATVTGLVEGDSLAYDMRVTTVNGVDYIEPYGENSQGNYKVKYVAGLLTTIAQIEAPLYNIAVINGTYYRLRKTTIAANRDIADYVKDLKNDGNTKIVDRAEYNTEPYDFENEVIEVDGKKYAYITRLGEVEGVEGYYTVANLDPDVVAAKNKIGAMNGSTPRWIIPEDQRYKDNNKTNSFHRDYKITLVKSEALVEQPLYNFLHVGTTYYRLKEQKIIARDIRTVVEKNEFGEVKPGRHLFKCIPEAYDFTNLVLTIDGQDYVYRDKSYEENLPEAYEAYYTVELEYVTVPNNRKLNRDDEWYNNEEGWLDGAMWNVPNDTDAYHRDYRATLHEGVGVVRKVTITSDWPEGKPAFKGTKITLTAHVEGFEGQEYTLQWQWSEDLVNWNDIDGENGETFTYVLDEETTKYHWRVAVIE